MVFQKIAEILSEIMEIDAEEITPETKLTADNGIEAISIAKLVILCENRLRITIHDEYVHSFISVNDIVKYIEKAQSEA